MRAMVNITRRQKNKLQKQKTPAASFEIQPLTMGCGPYAVIKFQISTGGRVGCGKQDPQSGGSGSLQWNAICRPQFGKWTPPPTPRPPIFLFWGDAPVRVARALCAGSCLRLRSSYCQGRYVLCPCRSYCVCQVGAVVICLLLWSATAVQLLCAGVCFSCGVSDYCVVFQVLSMRGCRRAVRIRSAYGLHKVRIRSAQGPQEALILCLKR